MQGGRITERAGDHRGVACWGRETGQIARTLDLSPEAFFALRWNRAEPSRETERRLRILTGKAPPQRHHPRVQPRYGR